jgi:hypothetical protein
VRVRSPIPVEACSSVRPFAIQQRWPALQPASATGSKLPACTFEAILRSASDPFDSALPPPSGFFSPSGAHSLHGTRCQIRPQNSLSVPGSSLPFRTSRSFRLKVLNPIPAREAYPCESPDLPSLPAAGFARLRIDAPVRVRYSVPGRSLPLDTAFRSPPTKAYLSINPHGWVNAPGLYLRSDSETLLDPFGYVLPSPCGFFVASRGTIHARNPLPSSIPKLSACLRTFAPLQDLSILPARSARPDSNRRSLPLRVARSSFAPRRVEIIS